MSSLKIALAQTRQTDDFDDNCRAVFEKLDEAAKQQVNILCFPETQTVGYRVDVSTIDTPVPVEKLEQVHQQVAARCGEANMACILGTEIPLESDPTGGKPYNSALVINERGEILGAHHKSKLTPMDATAYTPGDQCDTYEMFGVTIGVVICFEGFRFPETTRECVRRGARIIFHPQNNTTRPMAWKIPVHHAMATTRAAENTVWFATCNCVHIPHQNARTMIIAPDGQVHARLPMRTEALLVGDVDVEQATRAMFLFDPAGCAQAMVKDAFKPQEYALR